MARTRARLRVTDDLDTVERTAAPDGRPHVVVVGGGIAGLATAWSLVRDSGETSRAGRVHPRVTVLESSPRLGGKLHVSELAGVPLDEGAEAMLAARPEALALARDLGLDDDVEHPATTSASVWSRGRLRPLPRGLVMGVPTDLRSLASSGILSLPGLLRLPLDHVLPRTGTGHDVAVGQYVADRLGREVVERLVDPLLGGVYAGSADHLSFEATVPSLFREAGRDRSLLAAAERVVRTGGRNAGARSGPVFFGLRGGVGRLPLELARALAARGVEIRTSATVRELRRTPDCWRLVLGPTRSPEVVDADAVVVTAPAPAAARLLRGAVPLAAAELETLEYASVAVVSYAYPADNVPALTGSGFLVPPVEGFAVKASTFSSAKWRWLADAAAGADLPGGALLVRASLGRHGEEALLQRDDDDLAALGHADLSDAVGIVGPPAQWRVTRWGGSLPQYAVGHRLRVQRVRDAVSELPGLAVAGAAYDGVGIAAVVGSAQYAAGQVSRWLDQRRQWAHG